MKPNRNYFNWHL